MEEAVSDAIHTGTNDKVLAKLIDIVVVSETESLPLFRDFLREEPVLFRKHFRKWIRQGMEEIRKINELEKGRGLKIPKK